MVPFALTLSFVAFDVSAQTSCLSYPSNSTPPSGYAASAGIQPVLRRSGPSRPSRNNPAETATRSWPNSGRMRV